MITTTQTDAGYLYACDACGWAQTLPFADWRNPSCHCGDPRRQLQEPSLVRKAANYTQAAARHVAAGRPLASDEQVAERFAICAACPLFKPTEPGQGVCTHPSCGCALKTVGLTGRNKLRWADSSCPLPKPRWAALSPPAAEV